MNCLVYSCISLPFFEDNKKEGENVPGYTEGFFLVQLLICKPLAVLPRFLRSLQTAEVGAALLLQVTWAAAA